MNKLELSEAENSELSKIVEMVFSQNPLQKKRITKYFQTASPRFWDFANQLSETLNTSFLAADEQREKAAYSYNKMCKDFLSEQIKFKRTGKYSCLEASDANERVYADVNVMRYYMVGLLLSYIFWPNHYELFQFFEDHLPNKKIKNYLEVGVGHGLFTSTMLKRFSEIEPVIVDISSTSINVAKEVLGGFKIDTDKIKFINNDFLAVEFSEKFDFIIMGEVLEHVNNAPLFLEKTKEILAEDGKIYLSTAANSPALDHVYHFHNVKEIRDLIISKGFRILNDLALASEDVPEHKWEQELVTINYCALLEHANES